MKHLLILFAALLLAGCKGQAPHAATPEPAPVLATAPSQGLEEAYARKQSNVWLAGEGTVKKLLPDDNKGARHQKFLVSISAKQTLLFAHNIDLAPRVENLQVGDSVEFKGEYVYNPKGGIMHWTHHDPNGKQGGYIVHHGKKYE